MTIPFHGSFVVVVFDASSDNHLCTLGTLLSRPSVQHYYLQMLVKQYKSEHGHNGLGVRVA